jgi:tetratricopeptide (TPR) repeat protein
MLRFSLIIGLLIGSFNLITAQSKIDSLMSLHQYDLVIEALGDWETLDHTSKKQLAEAQLKSGRLYLALDSYEKLYTADSNQNYLLQQASIQEKLNEETAALRSYIKLNEIAPENAYYWKLTAKSAMKNSEYPLSLAAWNAVLERSPQDLEAINKMALLYNKLDQAEQADSLLKVGLSIAPNANFLKQSLLKVLYRERAYEDAVKISEELFAAGDSGLVIQKIAGIANYHQEDFQKCITLLSNVAEVESESDYLHYYLGLAYRDSGDKETAVEYLEKAIELGVTKNLGNYYTQLAVSYEEAGETAKAIQAYKVAYSESKDKVLLYHLARNYDSFYKDKKVALSYYEKYLQEKDTANEYLMNYSKHRIQELKNAAHFDGSSF